VSNYRRRQQRTTADGSSQVRHAAALAVLIATWLRDEEANAQRGGVDGESLTVAAARSGVSAIDGVICGVRAGRVRLALSA
jgi:ribosomal protein L22